MPTQRSVDSHLLKQVGVVAADFELFVVPLDKNQLTTAKVARHTGDRLGIDDRAAVNLPKLLGIELVNQFLDWLSDQRLKGFGLHSRVFLVRREKENFRGGYQSQLLSDARLYPLQVTASCSTAGRFQLCTELTEQIT